MKKPKWWIWVNPLIVALVSLSLIPLALVYYARETRQTVSRVSIVPNMDKQPKFESQTTNSLFADGRSMRQPVEGTVARGKLNLDEHFMQGIVDGNWAEEFPAAVTVDDELLSRGQERYEVFCAACHGSDGYGAGLVATRAEELAFAGKPGMTWTAPTNYHTDDMRSRPVGHIYNSISNGIRNMPAYATQIPVEDRWAIIAYVRALQLSQWAPVADAPAEEQQLLLEHMPPPAADEDTLLDAVARIEQLSAEREGYLAKISELGQQKQELLDQFEKATEEEQAQIIAGMEADIAKYNEQVAQLEAESELIKAELDNAEAEKDVNEGGAG